MRERFLVILLLMLGNKVSSQVNLQEGNATFTVPIYNWSDSKSKLALPLSISYNSNGGLKVDAVASNIGQGWNLNAGGQIQRIQIGQPDDQYPVDGNYSDLSKFPAGYLYNQHIANGCPVELYKFPTFKSAQTVYQNDINTDADHELDHFIFQFNGRSGTFVLGALTGSTGNTAVLLGDSKVKVTYDADINKAALGNLRTSIYAFHIQDENGVIYTFKDLSLTKILLNHSCLVNADAYGNLVFKKGLAPFDFGNHNYNEAGFDGDLKYANYVVTGWYLSSITDVLNGRVITFNYEYEDLNDYAGKTIRTVKATEFQPKPQNDNIARSPVVIVSHRISITRNPNIMRITFPDDNSIDFKYAGDRADLKGDKMLNTIQLSFQGKIFSQFLFSQSYFIKNEIRMPASLSENRLARLCLTSVQKASSDPTINEPPYLFDYYLGTDNIENFVPPPFCDARDIWGYYNGNYSELAQTDAVIRSYDEYLKLCLVDPHIVNTFKSTYKTPTNIKSNYAMNGLLKKITYPLGGSLSYEYAQNIGAFPGESYDDLYGGVHVSKTIVNDGSYNPDQQSIYQYTLKNGRSSLWGIERPINHQASSSSQGQLNGPNHFPGVSYIRQATNIKDLSSIINSIKQFYSGFSSGSALIDQEQTISTADAATAFSTVIIALLTYKPPVTNAFSNYITFYNTDLNAQNLLPIQFKNVSVLQVDASNVPINGQTNYSFTSDDDYPVIVSDNSGTFSNKQRYLPWVYGLPKLVTSYNQYGVIVKQVENRYDFSPTLTQSLLPLPNYTCFVQATRSDEVTDWKSSSAINSYATETVSSSVFSFTGFVPNLMIVEAYNLYSGHTPLADSYDRSYSQPFQFLQTHVQYTYSENNLLPRKITTTLSNGDQKVDETYYSADFSSDGVLQTMLANNIVDVPIANYHSVVKNNVASYLGGTVTEFISLPNGDIRPYQIHTGRSTQPIGLYSFDPDDPLNYPNLVTTKTFEYDPSSNLIKTQDEGGRVITNLYDYNDQFNVATIINADPDQDKCAYSSFETNSLGGWIVNGTVNYDAYNSITGSRGLVLNNNDLGSPASITTNVTINKPYILSFWATDIVHVDNATLKHSGPSLNGFTYYEYSVQTGATPPLLTGNSSIDELRLYPADARMASTTFDPVFGKTSECDANNRIVYYEYDFLGRLRFIRDEKKNIVKMYDYNFKRNN